MDPALVAVSGPEVMDMGAGDEDAVDGGFHLELPVGGAVAGVLGVPGLPPGAKAMSPPAGARESRGHDTKLPR